jgi:endonuclease YncB( thermonuclease family)
LGVALDDVSATKGKRRGAWLAIWAGGLFLVPLSPSLHATKGSCGLDRAHEKALVEYVYDGDTIRLADGRKVRLIGVDAPELGHNGRSDQPLAKRAKAKLTQLAKPNTAVQLRYDEQRRDSYGRTLAHLFLMDGTNVQRDMISSGLATATAVPPNLWQLQCHLSSEASAQAARRGLWSLARYQPVEAQALAKNARGFYLITGRVQQVGKGRKTVWLQLTKRVTVQIPHSDTHYFTQYSPTRLKGRRILARGWLTPRRYGVGMIVRHPSALRVLD